MPRNVNNYSLGKLKRKLQVWVRRTSDINMVSIANLVRRFGIGRPETLFECRRCGTSLDAAVEVCPECESAEIASYRIAT